MDLQINNRCPRCGEGQLRTWHELKEDEREVVTRLAGSAEHTLEQRRARHLWCTRCWFESKGDQERRA